MLIISSKLNTLIREALREDVGKGDLTTKIFVSPRLRAEAHIFAKQSGVLCGESVLRNVFAHVNSHLEISIRAKDGDFLREGEEVFVIRGSLRSILIGERVALNFISHLSGVATLTRKYVEKVKGTNAQIYDTRKTTPLWRELEKYAVRSGGGTNHRIGLDDQVLIKENHWRSITNDKVIRRKINEAKKKKFTEIEVRDLNELRCVLPAKPHAILFDNFSLGKLKEGVQIAKRFHPTPVLEASGGVSLENVRAIAKTGVDRISIGALTHSAPAFDFSLLVRDIHSK